MSDHFPHHQGDANEGEHSASEGNWSPAASNEPLTRRDRRGSSRAGVTQPIEVRDQSTGTDPTQAIPAQGGANGPAQGQGFSQQHTPGPDGSGVASLGPHGEGQQGHTQFDQHAFAGQGAQPQHPERSGQAGRPVRGLRVPGGPVEPDGAAYAHSHAHENSAASHVGRTALLTAIPVALLAAGIASAATYGLTKGNGSTLSTGNTTVLKANPQDFADAGSINWSATAAKVSPSVVSIKVSSESGDGDQGSGVILDKKGDIVTNDHVVAAAASGDMVQVTLNDNRTFNAKVVGTDPSTDLAVLRIDNVPELTPIQIADTGSDNQKLVVGQPTMAVGNPLGLSGTVTTGIISALNRPVQTSGSGDSNSHSSSQSQDVITSAIQTSAAINPGNSGGALVDGSGKLIGINSSIASLSDGSSSSGAQSGSIGIGFAIPATVVKNITGQLLANGSAQHPLLGIETMTTQVKDGGATLMAARVHSVEKGGAAAAAGLKSDDAIISVNGNPVTSDQSLIGLVRAHKVGDEVTLVVIRDGSRQTVKVKLGKASTH